MSEFNVIVGTSGIRREIGEVINVGKTSVVFQYKKPRSSKRVQITVPADALISLKVNEGKSEIVFVSNVYDLVEYSSVTNVKADALPGISVGETKQGEKLYFAPARSNVTSLVAKEKKEKKADKGDKAKAKPGKEVKKAKGDKIKKKSW
jgi:hypothetical protein